MLDCHRPAYVLIMCRYSVCSVFRFDEHSLIGCLRVSGIWAVKGQPSVYVVRVIFISMFLVKAVASPHVFPTTSFHTIFCSFSLPFYRSTFFSPLFYFGRCLFSGSSSLSLSLSFFLCLRPTSSCSSSSSSSNSNSSSSSSSRRPSSSCSRTRGSSPRTSASRPTHSRSVVHPGRKIQALKKINIFLKNITMFNVC